MDTIISVRNLVKIYKNGIRANDNISFSVKRGEILGILGPNGAGKTTLIKQITGLLKPTSGSIEVMGIDVVKNPQAVKRFISVCPQETAILGDLTVYEHLYYFGRLRGLDRDTAKAQTLELLDEFRLKDYSSRYVGSLSKGLQRRVIVAQAFLGEPEIVFLDEPSTHLDPVSRHDVWSTIREYNKKGVTILLATHYMEEAERLSNRVMFINRGRVVTIGSISEVKQLVGDYIGLRLSARFSSIISRYEGVKKIKQLSSSTIEAILVRNPSILRDVINTLIDLGAEFEVVAPSLEDVFLEVSR